MFFLQKSVTLPLQKEDFNMEHLPQDPFMLVSSINMLLRDGEYESLESLCDSFDRDPAQLKAYLLEHGYTYSEEQRQMRPVGYDD